MTRRYPTALIFVVLVGVVAAVAQYIWTNSAITKARDSAAINSFNTESAVQQQVANGWEMTDQLDIIIAQNQFLLVFIGLAFLAAAILLIARQAASMGNNSEDS